MYDVRFALDGAITCRIYQAGYMQAAYWDPGTCLNQHHVEDTTFHVAMLQAIVVACCQHAADTDSTI